VRILLTGAKGNLGSAIQRIGRGHEFIAIDRDNWSDISKLREGDVIIHAASDLKTPIGRDPAVVMHSNLTTTLDLLKACEKAKPSQFVFISSCAVYGRGEITKEETPPTPLSVNGITKLLNEKIIAEFCDARGINYKIPRVFNTFGGKDEFSIIHHLQMAVEKRIPFQLNNNGLSQRDFVHVDDVAAIVLGLLEKTLKERIINVGSGDTVKIKDIVVEFQRKHPKLEIVHKSKPEAEYSRGDITRLRDIFPDYRFQGVLEFLRS